MLGREAAKTNFIVFGLTRQGLEPMIYRTRAKHVDHYTTNAVVFGLDKSHFERRTLLITGGSQFVFIKV